MASNAGDDGLTIGVMPSDHFGIPALELGWPPENHRLVLMLASLDSGWLGLSCRACGGSDPLGRRGALCRAAGWLLASLPVLAALGALARWADWVPARVVGLSVLGAVAGSLVLVGWSLAKYGEHERH